MTDDLDDKRIEQDRYDRRAKEVLAMGAFGMLGLDGAAAVPVEIRTPYVVYEELIRKNVTPGTRVLDLCCGTGLFSLVAAHAGASVTVSDIAPGNVELAILRGQRAGLTIDGVTADAENLPFADASFSCITCAGSLSYVDLNKFLLEVARVLRPGGSFVFVDSLNHNPVYRLNRYFRYLRGDRSKSTLQRMPTMATLDAIRTLFPDLQIQFFGIIAFLAPLLRLLSQERARREIHRVDAALPFLRRYAFKVVGAGRLSLTSG